MSSQDSHINRTIRPKMDNFPPKLRKNRKLELRWGSDYYDSINKAVFSNGYLPYMPSEPPTSIKEDVDKTGYVCKQCRDCFRFLSSIEEHTSRRSWVLGYWCQSCFTTKCTHVSKDEPMCSSCRNIDASKNAYLSDKGVKKNFKKAVTRVFYNQCQFFAHLRMHGIVVVDLSEIMLMPLPGGTLRIDYGQLDRLCKALMETMFIRRTHIMDWLRELNITSNRWNELLNWMESKKKTPITDILGRYSEDCLNMTDLAERKRKDSVVRQSVEKRKIMSKDDSNDSHNNEKDPLAEDDDTPNDIAFVDCGTTSSNVVITEFPNVNATKDSGNGQNVERANSLWRSFSQQYDRQKDKSRDTTTKQIDKIVDSSSTVNINNPTIPRVLTIRGPKNLNITTIMKHLPVDEASKKNIIVVADKSTGEKSLSSKNDNNTSMKNPLEQKIKEKPLNSELVVATIDKNNPKIETSTNINDTHPRGVPLLTKSQSFSEQMSLHGRIVFQNGRKYIIRHVPKTKTSNLLNDSIVKKFRNPPPLIAPISGTKIPLLPKQPIVNEIPILPKPTTVKIIPLLTKPTPIKLTKITPILSLDGTQKSTTIGSKRTKISAKVTNITASSSSLVTLNANLTTQNCKARLTKLQKNLMIKYRDALMISLHRSTRQELQSYIKHLREINEVYAKTMNLSNDEVLTKNAKAIEYFENVEKFEILPEQPWQPSSSSSSSSSSIGNVVDIFERNTRDWESRLRETEKQRKCDTCQKRIKPSSYIVGISIPAKNEKIYCNCYNNVCHLCNANQGSLIQLKAHANWHKREKPYMCPSCSIVFPTFVELEIHAWTQCYHPMIRYIYGCGICDIEGILDMESIAKHFLLLHTRRKIVCPVCKMECTGTTEIFRDYMRHFEQHHPDIVNIPEPKRVMLCNLKQCVIRPELFRAHLSDHIGVIKWIYYKCPFCPTVSIRTGQNKTMIREHIIEKHLNRMHEIVSNESLDRIIDGMRLRPTNVQMIGEEIEQICQVSNDDPTGPKILDARTITPATFELGSENFVEPMFSNDETNLPKILDVRSEAVEEFQSDERKTDDFELEILTVRSIADNSLNSPEINNDTINLFSDEKSCSESLTMTDPPERINLRMNTSLFRESMECDDSSNSHDEISVVSINSKIDDSEHEMNSCLLDAYNDNQEFDPKNDDIAGNKLKALLTDENIMEKHRPWRIALNSPTNVEIEPIVYNCHLCGELINTSPSVIKNHFEMHHSRDYEIFTVTSNIPRVIVNQVEQDYRNDTNGNEKKRKTDVSPPTNVATKRRKRWGPKKHIERPGSPSIGIFVKPEPIEVIEGSYRCKKCDCLFDDISMLRNHIAMQHRIKGQYLVCLECGENFVVAPSLQMHLKALHGIEDPINYLANNTGYAPEILDDTEEDEKATESNQCYVCMAVFENKPALDKHIRVHGMAFLRRKRFEAQKAMKICAKINNSGNETSRIEGMNEKTLGDAKLMIKRDGAKDGNVASSMTNEKSVENQIKELTTIMKIEKIDTLPMT